MLNKSVVACSKLKAKTEITASNKTGPNPFINTQVHQNR